MSQEKTDYLLSVIIPAYNESQGLDIISGRLRELLCTQGVGYEIIIVDDGSSDDSWQVISSCGQRDPNVRGIRFSRNFGKEAAIFSGLSSARGDCAVVLDGDMQHPPETILEMLELWREGYQVIEGVKANRGRESVGYRLSTKLFYSLISKNTGIDMKRSSDFKLLDRKAIDAIISLPERQLFFRAMSGWVGFKTASVEFCVQERSTGESKWPKASLIKYAINNITSFSTAPMQLVTIMGIITFIITLILGIQTLVMWFMGRAQEGFTTVILLILLLASIIMVSLGIIGYYVARVFEELKGRPRYIIQDTTETDKEK